jgi:crossover junction endodeoxyribonuclease RusA
MNRNVPPAAKPGPLPTLVRTGVWELQLPFTRQLSLNDRQHWAVKMKHVKEWRDAAHVLARAAKIPNCRRIKVELHYVPRTNQRRDPDNLVASLKPLVDGLVDAGVVADDTEAFVERSWPVIHRPSGVPGRFYMRVEAL